MSLRQGIATLLPALLAAFLVVGCGEKIAVPEPEGLFSVSQYQLDGEPLDAPDARQVLTLQGSVFLLEPTRLVKMNQAFDVQNSVTGFADARRMCVDDRDELIFVWDQGTQTMSWYLGIDLSEPQGVPGQSILPEVQSCTGLATGRAGVGMTGGGQTFVYVADPDSGVVHRYVYDPFTGLAPYGILCNDQGEGTRVAKQPAGLARDRADSLLVCDIAPDRHWVIRFNGTPDLADTTATGEPLWRGLPVLFDVATDDPPPPADYVLGNAPGADGTAWDPGPSSAEGEFDEPRSVAVDGSGRIFVADHGNHRVQVFNEAGVYDFAFGDSLVMPYPESVAVIDESVDPPEIDYGAYLLILGDGVLRKFISGEHYDAINEDPGPLD